MTEFPVAHAAHWYFLPIYAAPVILILCTVAVTAIRERRQRREDAHAGAPDEDD
jgi:hypothetical protein